MKVLKMFGNLYDIYEEILLLNLFISNFYIEIILNLRIYSIKLY